jgi:hypothetical protein
MQDVDLQIKLKEQLIRELVQRYVPHRVSRGPMHARHQREAGHQSKGLLQDTGRGACGQGEMLRADTAAADDDDDDDDDDDTDFVGGKQEARNGQGQEDTEQWYEWRQWCCVCHVHGCMFLCMPAHSATAAMGENTAELKRKYEMTVQDTRRHLDALNKKQKVV